MPTFDEIFDLERLRKLWVPPEEDEPDPFGRESYPERPRLLVAHAELTAAIRRRLGHRVKPLEPLLERARVLLVAQTGWVEPEEFEDEDEDGEGDGAKKGDDAKDDKKSQKKKDKKEKKDKKAEEDAKKKAEEDAKKKKKDDGNPNPDTTSNTLYEAGATMRGAGLAPLGKLADSAATGVAAKDVWKEKFLSKKAVLEGEALDANKLGLVKVLEMIEDLYEALDRAAQANA